MLESSVLLASGSGGGATSSTAVAVNNEEWEAGGSASGGIREETIGGAKETDRNLGGNRWPREDTLVLLKIRSDMDAAFRDSTLKAPLWDEISRKLAKLGYHRSPKKCKEKFENIYKYHKRTKEGRSGRQSGKNYRFFEQLEVFESLPLILSPPSDKIQTFTTETSMAMPMSMTKSASVALDVTPTCSTQNTISEFMSTSMSTTSSYGKESEGSFKKKRKLADYFERLMKQMLEKQENLQNKFIEAIEKCERDRTAREEVWKMKEMARLKKEQDKLAQERAIAAAKDAALIAFLQKISEQAVPVQVPENITTISGKIVEKQDNSTIYENSLQASSSRWPKAEVEALITIRTNFDMQCQDKGLKGSLWEEISSAMKKLGYDRSSKRCKEKWENINKYYRRVRESNKRRPEDSKTCPYFHMLESVYDRKSKKIDNSDVSACSMKPEDILMQMMGRQQHQQEQQLVTEVLDGANVAQNPVEDGDDDNYDNTDDYHIVVNNFSAAATTME